MEQQKAILVKVGIFCLVGLLILIWFSLQPMAQDKVEQPYTLTAYFNEAKSLEEGEIVALMGKKIGKVKSIEFDQERRKVKINMMIAGKYSLPRDSEAGIYFKSLLGRYYVNIMYGAEGEMLDDGDVIKTHDVPDLNTIVESLGEMSTDTKDLFTSLNENQKKVSEKITSLVDENRENIKQATSSFAKIGPELENVANELQDMITEMRKGDSTLSRLLRDDEMYTKLDTILENINTISSDIKEGEGTLSKLLYDDTLHQKLDTTLTSIDQAAGEAKQFMGDNKERFDTVLTKLENTTPKLEKTADNFAEISQQIKDGKGSLGKLVNDPSLYDDAQRTLNQIEQTFREGEEQGVMRAVVSVLFSTLM